MLDVKIYPLSVSELQVGHYYRKKLIFEKPPVVQVVQQVWVPKIEETSGTAT